MIIEERIFTLEDQDRFSRLSGDRNPLHLDPAWAASVYPGKVVVHGVHLVLWSLDKVIASKSIARLSASFVWPVLIGDLVRAKVSNTCEDMMLQVFVGNTVMARIKVEFGQASPTELPATHDAEFPVSPRALSLEDLYAREGVIGLPKAASLSMEFPCLAKAVGESSLRGLAGLSTLVGMECPGLHAVFVEFSMKMQTGGDTLRYRVSDVDPRVSRVSMVIEGALAGTVVATVSTPDIAELPGTLNDLVTNREFSDQTPLVIGGGSGLGATSAMLLAAGGASPVVTVNQGLKSGQRIRQEIIATGGRCDLIQLDVTRPVKGLSKLRDLGWRGGEVYYFASPRIFRRRLDTYQDGDFADFMRIYVGGFYEVIRSIQEIRGEDSLRVFYPSSIAVETFPLGMLEYALAKQAGEALCRALERKFSSLQIVVERLPRVDSRQTRGFIRVAAASPAEIMLPILRQMNPRLRTP